MPIQSQDLTFYLTGGQNNFDPTKSLGGDLGQPVKTINSINNLFGDIVATDHAAGNTSLGQPYQYRTLGLKIANPLADNSNSTLVGAQLTIQSSALLDSSIQVYLPSQANVVITPGNLQAIATISDETPQVPSIPLENLSPTDNGPILFQPIGSGLNLPTTLNPGDIYYFVLRRSVNAGQNSDNETITLAVTGSTN